MTRKILYYNWCPINEKQGGGIVVYQNNVLNELAQNFPDAEPYFLSAGFYYDDKHNMYLREEHLEGRKNIYSFVNSPIYSPIQSPIDNIEQMLNNTEVLVAFRKFLQEKGPFVAIHFETLEGLPLSVGNLKKEFPNTKFLISAHNYTLVCPNVQLWTDTQENCMLRNTRACEKCLMKYSHPSTQKLKSYRIFEEKNQHRLYFLSRAYTVIRRRSTGDVGLAEEEHMSEVLNQYRKACIDTVNEYFDTVLAVSRRVRDIVISFGIRPDKVKVSYIGTKFADIAKYKLNKPSSDSSFGIVYMGYMRVEKGFYFFLQALENMDPTTAKNIDVTFASKVQDFSALRRMNKLKKKFNSITIYNGYTHDDIADIVHSNTIGVVPVMWEDNLPQVAIEMIANGLPVLTSSFGGASELNSNPAFVYEGGNSKDFVYKIINIYEHRNLLDEYWNTSMKLRSMKDHVTELMNYYQINTTE